MAKVELKLLTILVKDGTAVTPNEIEIEIGEGNFKYSEFKDRTYDKNKGLLDVVRNGDERPVEIQFDFTWVNITASTGEPPTMEDALKQKGTASSWVTTDSDTCQPYAVDLEVQYVPLCDDVESEVISLPLFRVEQFDHDPETGQISCTGKCNITEATATRIAITA